MTDTTGVGGPAAVYDHYSKAVDAQTWWEAHFDQAAGKILSFFGSDGISLEGKRVADVGCGDGIIDLGLAVRGKPTRMVGFDIEPTDVEELIQIGCRQLGIDTLPDSLSFVTCGETSLPADDDAFDFVVSWSAFEHIADPRAVLREIRRVLTDQGVLFIQVWPFYDSEHGTHLMDWFPQGFAQFEYSDEEIVRRVRSSGDQAFAAEMLEIYRTLNKITLDDLHADLREAGFKPVKVSLSAEAVHIPDSAAHLPPSRSAISGVQLLAIPDDTASAQGADQAEIPEPRPEPKPQEQRPPRAAPLFKNGVRAVRTGLAKLDGILARNESR
jgi:ubiquinone/menaquinone biosynthesis C-methylase UbiE